MANTLSESPAGHLNDQSADIIGYTTVTGRFVKYDKNNNLIVVYVDDNQKGHEAIALYKQPINKFFRKLNTEGSEMQFKSHLPKEQS